MKKSLLILILFFSIFLNASEPIAEYRFDECQYNGTDNEVKDSSSNHYDGKSNQTPTSNESQIGRSLDFSENIDNNYYVMLNDNVTNGLLNFTVSVWIKTNISNQNQMILASNSEDFRFYLYKDNDSLKVYIKGSGKEIKFKDDAVGKLTDNQWHNIIIVREDEYVKFYLDGIYQNYKTFSTDALETEELKIGQNNASSDMHFEGYIDELKIWNEVLSESDISTYYSNESDGKNYDGTTRTSVSCIFDKDYFITTWKTTTDNEDITIPMIGTDYQVDWDNDGVIDETVDGPLSHTFASAGDHTIRIYHDTPQIQFNNEGDKDKIISIDQWGTGKWTSMESAFYGCSNMEGNFTDIPDLSTVNNMNSMFKEAKKFNSNINNWDVSNVYEMGGLFANAVSFNQPIGDWNTSNVSRMYEMFMGASNFNQPIGNWNTSNVTLAYRMFSEATNFNQPIGDWNTSNLVHVGYMFENAINFNQPIGDWDVSNVEYMDGMFSFASSFNQPIGNWNLASVEKINHMFYGASSFNQPIGDWNVSGITNMDHMLNETNFNQDISKWDVSNVTSMKYMLDSSNMSVINYDKLLISWNSQDLQQNVEFQATNLKYCKGESARANMIASTDDGGDGWDITNEGKDCSVYKPTIEYRFDECNWGSKDGDVLDSINENNATSHSAKIITNGVLNNAGDFDKTANSYITSTLNGIDKNSWSFSCWVKIQTVTDDDTWQPILIAKSDPDSRHGTFSLWYRDSDNSLGAWFQDDPNTLSSAVGPNTTSYELNDGNWHFLAATYDGKDFSLYVDQNSPIILSLDVIPENFSTASDNFWIGRTIDNEGNIFQSQMLIDEVKVFDITLFESAVQDIYKNELSHKNHDGSHRMVIDCTTPELLAEYRFDECKYSGASKEVKDSKDGDNNGTIVDDVSISKDEKIIGHSLQLNGGAVDINDLDVSTEKYKKNTVMFWMYWDGDTNSLPFGWSYYNIWTKDGQIMFNTGESDRYGVSMDLKNNWHHITAVFTNGDVHSNRLYIDAQMQTLAQLDGYPNDEVSYCMSEARIAGWTVNQYWRFKSYLDELKIYKGELDATTIRNIYENELDGKNYDGSTRDPIICAQPIFNAVNQNGGCFNWDNNITTKTAGSPINLTILSADKNDDNNSLQDVNITKLDLLSFSDASCNSLYNTYEIWSGNVEVNSTGCWNLAQFTYDKAVKCAKIKISGIFEGVNVESNSTDTFSIRPDKFILSSASDLNQKLTAEHEYTFRVVAMSTKSTPTTDYNSSITPTNKKYFRDGSDGSSMAGDFVPTSAFVFNDGQSGDTTLSFNNVGKIGLEINDTIWSEVDSDDTPLADRTIYLEQNLTFIPDHFKIEFQSTPTMNNHYIDKFTYLSSNLAMKAKLENLDIKITAEGEKGAVMTNYQNPQSTWFANNVDLTPTVNISNSPNTQNIPSSLIDTDLSFSSGIATHAIGDIYFNYDRNRSNPINPFTINGSEANISVVIKDHIDMDVNGTVFSYFDKDATFYYGRMITKDIKTSKTPTKGEALFVVYSTSKISDFEQYSTNWYINKLDSYTLFSPKAQKTRTYSSSNEESRTSTGTNIQALNGKALFDITANETGKSFKAYYHVGIFDWLWYSKYEDYHFIEATSCISHPCFEYIFETEDDSKGIKSGTFKGASFKNDFNSSRRKAIKIMR